MEAKSYFNEDIYTILHKELSKSTKSIYAAVAWFSDIDIYELLVLKAKSGVVVQILISDSEENNISNFEELVENGGIVYRLPPQNRLMHHKFCIIDEHTLITGSYNWTYSARKNNLENIVLIENNIKLNSEYIQIFNQIIDNEFKHIGEAISILNQMIEEIEKTKEKINKYKEIPTTILSGIEKIKNGKNLLSSHLSKLIEPDTVSDLTNVSTERNVLSVEEKLHWWNKLPNHWKYTFNENLLKLGYNLNIPDEENIDYILKLTFIDCSLFKYPVPKYEYNKNNIRRDWIEYPKISDLDGLTEMQELQNVICSNMSLSSITQLSGHKYLSKLVCSNNKITSIEPLKLLKKLTFLDISKNPILTLKGLENLTNLEYLKCDSKFFDFPSDKERINSLKLELIDTQNGVTEFRKISLGNSIQIEEIN